MPEKSIAVLPSGGYGGERHSKIGMAYIYVMEKRLGLRQVRSARKGYEVKLGKQRMDGVGWDREGKMHCLLFNGCFWHGCPCIAHRTPILEARAEMTRRSLASLTALATNPASPYGPFQIHVMKECEFLGSLSEHELGEVKRYLRRYSSQQLRPRDAFRGGRTSTVKHLIPSVEPGWQLKYFDFTSLYPSINFSQAGEEWPIAEPEIFIGVEIEEKAGPIESWLGLVKVTVLPPRHLHLPVLGQIIRDRYIFHLCRSCAESGEGGFCNHSNAERQFTGTFVVAELRLALSKGYEVVMFHELWTWGKDKRSTLLFRGLIRDQYGKKATASPIPKDPAELAAHIREINTSAHLSLTPPDFSPNAALRILAKLSINAFWGFWATRTDRDITVIISTFSEWHDIENDPEKLIKCVTVSEDSSSLMVTFGLKEEQASGKQSVVLAGFSLHAL